MTRQSKIAVFFLVCSLLMVFPLIASAHSGRTDANGGHYVGGTNEYHYHHGYPAHDHINGECPYDFDDKTNHGSGGGSSGSSDGSSKPSSNTVKEDPGIDWLEIGKGICASAICIFGFIFVCSVANSISEKREAKRKQEREKEREEELRKKQEEERKRLEALKKAAEEMFQREKEKYLSSYGGMSYEDIFKSCDPPEGVTIDEQGVLTFEISDKFFVYISSSGTRYHRKGCVSNSRAVLYHNIKSKGYSPCQRCKPTPLDTNWLRKYKKIAKAKEKYDP